MEYYISNKLVPIQDSLIGQHVLINGRVRSIHDSKTKFIHIERDTHKFQLMIRSTSPCYKTPVSNLDIIEAEGVIERNTRGNIVLCPTRIEILSPAIRKIGKTYGGQDLTSDPELLYRHPYIGMIQDGELNKTLKFQANIVKRIRSLLDDEGFTEVFTPVLVHTNGGATAKPFKTHHNKLNKEMYLRIAPELNLKRLMVGGMEGIYEIGPSFRNEGIDRTHNPEFISMEAYKAYVDYNYWIRWFRILLGEIFYSFKDHLKVDSYQETIKNRGIKEISLKELNPYPYNTVLEKLESLILEFPDNQITIVKDFPIEDSPLAARNKENPEWADRFEIYLGKMEVVNGYTELTDPVIQRNIMKEQAKLKGDEFEYDEEYCNALEFGLVPCAGIGIGINRLIMWLLGKSNIKDVLSFPFYK